MIIRNIKQEDNAPLAAIIRSALVEHDAAKPGTVYFDDATDHLFEVFQQEGSKYFVVEENGVVIGGAGIFPTDGLDPDTSELVKMYLSPAARNKGLGKMLMQKCIEAARSLGYKKIYLETMPQLKKAIRMYQLNGFKNLDKAMGNTGHNGCAMWMLKELN